MLSCTFCLISDVTLPMGTSHVVKGCVLSEIILVVPYTSKVGFARWYTSIRFNVLIIQPNNLCVDLWRGNVVKRWHTVEERAMRALLFHRWKSLSYEMTSGTAQAIGAIP